VAKTRPAQVTAIKRPDVAAVERGATGTENMGGIITGEEYNSALVPPNCFRIYDEMRMSDPHVQASLEIVKTPIQSANWTVQPPKEPTPQEQEVADFCQSALFERGAMKDTWKYFLEHALMQLDFGVMPFERVWTLGGDNRVRLHRLAPRLPRTIQKWVVDEKNGTGDLQAMEQLAMKDGRFQTLTIPADALSVFVRKREGDNWWGRSILRSAYKPWYYLCQAERAEAVRIFRYGVGVPVASRDKDYGPKDGELEKVEAIAKGMVSHEKSYIVTHTGWNWSILVPQGGTGGDTGTALACEKHAKAIMRNVLAEFMAGGADGLNSGRTRTLANVFTSMLYSTSEDICGVLDLTVLRPLCEFNFQMEAQKLRYPSIVANDVTDVDVKQLSDIVGRLTAFKIVTADDDLEGFFRELLGLPALQEMGRNRDRVAVPPSAPGDGNADPKDKGGKGKKKPGESDDGDEGDENEEETVDDKVAAARRDARPAMALSKADRIFRLDGRDYGRQPTNFELRVFSLGEVPDHLDSATTQLVSALSAIRRQQLEKLALQIAKKDGRKSTGEFTDLRPNQFSVSMKADVERAIKEHMRDAANFGAEQVRAELHRQASDDRSLVVLGRKPHSRTIEQFDAWFDFALAGAGKNKSIAKSALTTSAKVATEAETDAWFNRILETATRMRRGGTQGDELAAAIQQSLLPELETGLKALAKGEINEAFSIGRATEATKLASDIGEVEYSCLLDANSCDPCAAEDGKTFAFESDEYFRTLPPFKDCEGNKGRPDACRCVHLYHLK
jgi:hypothetical protein